MNNLYYYTFYLMVRLVKCLNKKDDSPHFGAVMLLSSTMFFNVCSILILLNAKLRNSWTMNLLNSSSVKITCLTIMIIIGILNYMALMDNFKSDRIIKFFNEKFKTNKQNNVKVALIIAYNILSILTGIYLSYLIGIHEI